MPNPWRAAQRDESARERRRHAEIAHHIVVGDAGGIVPPQVFGARAAGLRAEAPVRGMVLDSWQRSLGATLDPTKPPSAGISAEELRDLRDRHPLTRLLPVVHRLLSAHAAESGFIVAVGDAHGRLLWVDGDHRLRSQAEDMGFTPGMDWSERAVGTSAPGTALTLQHSVQVLGAEHFNVGVHQWGCTAVPVRDPDSGAILGVLDLTGGDEAVAGHTLALVEATVAAVEAELRLAALRAEMRSDLTTEIRTDMRAGQRSGPLPTDRSTPVISHAGPAPTGRNPAEPARPAPPSVAFPPSVLNPVPLNLAPLNSAPLNPAPLTPAALTPAPLNPAPLTLQLLGRDPALLRSGAAIWLLGNRHAEILTALATHPAGVSAARLAELVYGSAELVHTLRPEMVRLRRSLERSGLPVQLLSRPYRLDHAITVDALEALAAVDRGAHQTALASYRGPALPSSQAPAVEALRAELDASLREAMLGQASPELLFRYAEQWAPEDDEVWETLLRALPPRSPKRARAVARLLLLQADHATLVQPPRA